MCSITVGVLYVESADILDSLSVEIRKADSASVFVGSGGVGEYKGIIICSIYLDEHIWCS